MNEQTRNELVLKLEILRAAEKQAWSDYKKSEEDIDRELAKLKLPTDPVAEARKVKDAASKKWSELNKAMEGLKVLLSMEGK